MTWLLKPPKRFRKVKTQNGQEVLHRIEEYLRNECGEPVEILCGFWKDQQDAITYQELRQAVSDGEIDQETLRLWQQDYAILVAAKLSKMWMDGIEAGAKGQPVLDGLAFEFNTQTPGILNWIRERGAEFVTSCTQEQKDAISALLTKKMREGHTVDELSRLIRPCIGLTTGQAKANARYYDSIVANLRKEHPRMKPESIRRKALEASQKYAERQHRQRALTIAQTESAFAYNRGADEGIRQAQGEGYLGTMKKRWNTSGDDTVCAMCAALDGVEIDMDSNFEIKGKLLFVGQHMLPPAHPRCACAIEYIEKEPPVFNDVPNMQRSDIDVTADNSLKTYSREEIESMAEQTEKIIDRHIDRPSKWSGKIVINNKKNPGKPWSCSIRTPSETSPHMIMHEQVHARSISQYPRDKGPYVYAEYQNIEEASVQYMTQEISKVEGIEIISSAYDYMTDALRRIRTMTRIFDTDYKFAKHLVEMPVDERLDWLDSEICDIMNASTLTIGERQEVYSLLDSLYTTR